MRSLFMGLLTQKIVLFPVDYYQLFTYNFRICGEPLVSRCLSLGSFLIASKKKYNDYEIMNAYHLFHSHTLWLFFHDSISLHTHIVKREKERDDTLNEERKRENCMRSSI